VTPRDALARQRVRCDHRDVRRTSLLLAMLACLSCGGRVATSDGSSGASSSSSSGSSPAPTATAVPPPTVGPAPNPTPVPPPPPTPDGKYSAHAWPGGLDHIDIYKASFVTDTCVHVHLTSPGNPQPGDPFGSISAPSGWAVRNADRSPGASTCGENTPGPAEPADAGKGFVSWIEPPGGTLFPCTLDLQVALVFKGSPGIEQMEAKNVSVDGCK
jgi:hypothetical protein